MTLVVDDTCQVAGCGDWLDGGTAWRITDCPGGNPDQVGHEECIKDAFLEEIRRMSLEDLARGAIPSIEQVTLAGDDRRAAGAGKALMTRTVELSHATYIAFQEWQDRHGRDGESFDQSLAYLLEEELSRDAEAYDQWRLQRA